jgi:signal transduction histidine kinase
MGLFERLTPRSITAQITGIVAVSMLLGMVLTIVILFLFVPVMPEDTPASVASGIAHATGFVRAANSPAEADAFLTAVRNSGVRVSRVAISDLETAPVEAGSQWFTSLLVRQLESHPEIEVLKGLRFAAGPARQVAVRLDAKDALIFDARTALSLWRAIVKPTTLVLIVVLIFVLLLSIYAVRWIIAPLAAVAEAALSFGRSPNNDLTIRRRGPREITQVADALNEMRTRIRALLEDRTRMLAAISHDLRTPLTRLRLRVERVSEPGLRDGMLADLVKVGRMLDETLDYLREDGKSEAMSRVDLPSLLQTICWDFADMGDPVTYQGPARLACSVRPRALTRALTNIVENGVKHGTTVTVTLNGTPREAVEITIADDGPGIPATLHGKVFEPFFKADSARTRNDSGFGLGLSIAQDIVKRHGGNISLLAREPAGLAVQILLPADMPLHVA